MNGSAWQRILLVLFLAPDWSEAGIEDEISTVTNCLPPDYMFKVKRRTTKPDYCSLAEALHRQTSSKSACWKEIDAFCNYTLKATPENSKCNGSSQGDRVEDMNFVDLTEFRCLVLREFKDVEDLDEEDACFERAATWFQCSTMSPITTTLPTHTDSATTGSTLSTTQQRMSTTQQTMSTTQQRMSTTQQRMSTTQQRMSTTQQRMSTTQTTPPPPETLTAHPSQTTPNNTYLKVSRLPSVWESSKWFLLVILLVSLTANVLFISWWARHRKLSMGPEINSAEQKVPKLDPETESEDLIGRGLPI